MAKYTTAIPMKRMQSNYMTLQGKNIILAICGGIAAYKTAHLVRLLVKKQANVKVVISENAKNFVAPLTLSVLSKNQVLESFQNNHNWNSHVELALWADVMVIAPATANTLAKMANGICDNTLLATYFSSKCPVFFAPAMDLDMFQHPTTSNNIKKLQSFGNNLIDSEYGELASGLIGQGRMAEPETIVERLEHFFFESKNIFLDKKILITAGPTYEPIDPVRFIGNFSSGKMGIALANAAQKMGAKVTLITGPTSEKINSKDIKTIQVTTAQQMYDATNDFFETSDIAILSAAVSDYTPKEKYLQKIKKKEGTLSLDLVKTKDILASLGEKKQNQKLIGFALETQNEIQNAKDKIKNKNLDAIILNSLNDKGAGFGTDTNKVTFIDANMQEIPIELRSKTELAYDILHLISNIV